MGWFRVSYEVAVGMLLGLQSSEGWTGTGEEGPLLRWPLTGLASLFFSCRLSMRLLLPPEQEIQGTEAELWCPL